MFFGVKRGVAFVQGDHSDQLIAEQQGHAQPGTNMGGGVGAPFKFSVLRGGVVNDQRLAGADDLVVTNPRILKDAIRQKLANGVIVKPNQVGTLTETLEFIKEAKANDNHTT